MAHRTGSKFKKVLYVFLSFVLSFLFLFFSVSIVFEATIFNKDFVLNTMSSTDYYENKEQEITRSLMDLGYASGLEESFFEGLIDKSLLCGDTTEYLNKFYSGTGSVVDTENFKNTFNNALDEYIIENEINPESVKESSRNYLVSNAAKIYKNSLELPVFNSITGYFIGVKNAMPIVICVVGVLILLICVIFVFSTRWKHRPAKYICYSTITAFLTLFVPAVIILASGKMKQLNIASKATYDLFIALTNGLVMGLFFTSIIFAVISIVLYVLYRRLYPKHSSHSGSSHININAER